MTLTIQSTDLIGAGVQFTFGAIGDQFYIRDGVLVAATSGTALGGASLANLSLKLDGELITVSSLTFGGENANIHIGSTGSLTGFGSSASNTTLLMTADDAIFSNFGSVTASMTVGVVARNFNQNISNFGSILAASPIFVFIASDATVVNGGTITATIYDDANQSERLNNGIFIDQSENVTITNLATGVITAAGETGAGVRFGVAAAGGFLSNAGIIHSQQDFGVNFGAADLSGVELRVSNSGTISGSDGAFNGSGNRDVVVNRGALRGDVLMGDGADSIDARNGLIDGNWFGGAGGDTYMGTLNTVVLGEIRGEAGNDSLFGGVNEDVLLGGDGDDLMSGGAGDDIMTGARAMILMSLMSVTLSPRPQAPGPTL